jgi:hypothetical protein
MQKDRETHVKLVEEAGQSCGHIEAASDHGLITIRPAGE